MRFEGNKIHCSPFDVACEQYEAVFISILTCQLSSFFVQNFVQRTTTTLYEQRQLCKDNDNFVRIMFTLCTNNVNFVQTTSTLQGQRRLCTNNVHTLYEQRQLCTNNVNFARTTSTLHEQYRVGTNNDVHLSEQSRILYEETRNYRLTCAETRGFSFAPLHSRPQSL